MRFCVSEINIDIQGHIRKAAADPFWTFAALEWHRLYQPYIPMRTGRLARQAVITPGQIEHTAPYARRIYAGRFALRNNLHPLASGEWDKAAEPAQKPKLIGAMQGYVDSGRLRLYG